MMKSVIKKNYTLNRVDLRYSACVSDGDAVPKTTVKTSWFTGFVPPHILRALRGRQPLCGTGVLSVMETTSSPPMVNPLMADYTQTEKKNQCRPSMLAHSNTIISLTEKSNDKKSTWVQILLNRLHM